MRIERFRTEAEWVEAVGEAFLRAAASASTRGGAPLRLCLAGGRTPEPAYRRLASLSLEAPGVELWLGDERDVRLDSADRNANLVLRAFRTCAWTEPPVFSLWPEGPAPEACAVLEARLRRLPEPFFDLSFLGIGEDGHTAGVFPGGPELQESARLAVPSRAPAEPRNRMTLAPRALASTRTLRFLLRGPGKRELAERLAEAPRRRTPDGLLPAELVARLTEERGADAAILFCEE